MTDGVWFVKGGRGENYLFSNAMKPTAVGTGFLGISARSSGLLSRHLGKRQRRRPSHLQHIGEHRLMHQR